MLAEAEDELVVAIPLIRGLSPIVVEPQAVLVTIKLEDVRVAIGIGIVWRAIWYHCPSNI